MTTTKDTCTRQRLRSPSVGPTGAGNLVRVVGVYTTVGSPSLVLTGAINAPTDTGPFPSTLPWATTTTIPKAPIPTNHPCPASRRREMEDGLVRSATFPRQPRAGLLFG